MLALIGIRNSVILIVQIEHLKEREWRMEVTDESQNVLYVLHINAEKPK